MKTIEQVKQFIEKQKLECHEAKDSHLGSKIPHLVFMANGALQLAKEILDYIDSETDDA